MTKSCGDTVVITAGAARAVERGWKQERVNFINCAERFDALVEWYKKRDADRYGPTSPSDTG